MDRRTITCVIQCPSEDSLRRSQEFAKNRINLTEVIYKTFRYYPEDVETLEQRSYRLSDYFDRIEVWNDVTEDPLSFALVFHTHKEVDPYWKDLIVSALHSMSKATGASIRSLSQTV